MSEGNRIYGTRYMYIQALENSVQESPQAIEYHLALYAYHQLLDTNDNNKIIISGTCAALYQAQQDGHSALPCAYAHRSFLAFLNNLEHEPVNIDFKSWYAVIVASDWTSDLAEYEEQTGLPLTLLPQQDLPVEQRRIALQRNYYLEYQISQQLLRFEWPDTQQHINLDTHTLNDSAISLDQDQLSACQSSLHQPLSIISGGPGSGKTSTIFNIICTLLFSTSADEKPPSIALAACTGKAAARLNQSIQQQLKQASYLNTTQHDLLKQQDLHAKTLHRLLGFSNTRQAFKYNQEKPLAFDVLIVDEISMLDFKLLHALLCALPHTSKLILIGDRNQLPAIEHGDILATLDESPLAEKINYLHGQYRFNQEQHIAQLLQLIQTANCSNELQNFLSRQHDQSLEWIDFTPSETQKLWPRLISGYAEYFKIINDSEQSINSKLNALNHFQILCPFNEGEFAVTNINLILDATFAKNISSTPAPKGAHYHGQPIIISQNDYQTNLYNGDLGIILYSEENTRFYAYFNNNESHNLQTSEHNYRAFELSQLPQYQLSYAMSIHKSQGSEFNNVFLIIPPAYSSQQEKLLQRKLIYTGISRAKQKISLCADLNTLISACSIEPKNLNCLSALLNHYTQA